VPPLLALYDDDDSPLADFTVSQDAGTESAAIVLRFWNDKAVSNPATTTAVGNRFKVLSPKIIGANEDGSPIYGALANYGTPVLDERWITARVLSYLSLDDDDAVVESTENATGTQAIGTNSELAIEDLPPQTGVRIEIKVRTPANQRIDAQPITFTLEDNLASSPLAPFTTLATGAAVIPPDRIAGLRRLAFGGTVTADGSDTVLVDAGQLVYEGAGITFLGAFIVFDLEDGDAVELDAGESYLVTLSLTPVAGIVATRGPKAETAAYPVAPLGNVAFARLTAASADGVAVTVDQSSVAFLAPYAGFYARAGAGLTVLVSRGDSVTQDVRQYLPREVPVNVTASETNRLWVLGDGSWVTTLTDTPPEFGALLTWLAVTDATNVTELVDVRPFAHRALTMWHHEVRYVGVLSDVDATEDAAPFDWLVLYEDTEIESVSVDLSGGAVEFTSGALKVDVLVLPPGADIEADIDDAVSIYTDAATDDRRPSIAFDATVFRAESRLHQVRRVASNSRVLLRFVSTFGASAPEAAKEVRVTLHGRRWR